MNLKKAAAELGWDLARTEKAHIQYKELKAFGANENIFESGQSIDEDTHRLMRWLVEQKLKEAFALMLIQQDENTVETPKRIVKVWCGDGLDCDTELGGGRFAKPVRLPKFPNNNGSNWITKEVRIISTCSHHFLPFVGKAIIRYKPRDYVLGISKLQRLANYVGNRFYLQEDLTVELHKIIMEAAQVEYSDVEVKIEAAHSCEMYRGVKNQDCLFTTEV